MVPATVALMGAAVVTLAAPGGTALGFDQSTAPRLIGTVGAGRIISLVDSRARRVRTLRHGTYRFVIRDRSAHDNFHLFGPGISGLIGATGISYRGMTLWKLRLVSGTYRFRSDAHPKSMRGTFRVT
jgi:hypothetical protein